VPGGGAQQAELARAAGPEGVDFDAGEDLRPRGGAVVDAGEGGGDVGVGQAEQVGDAGAVAG
jgi:hypothetical protein